MNNTEYFIGKIYESIFINDPGQLSIENVALRLQFKVYYWPYSSEIVELNGVYKVFINQQLSPQQQWQDFGHEMKHYFLDGGSQYYLTDQFIRYQETKADYFSYHFCVPTFMLQQLNEVTVYNVMQLFDVELDFALRRLEMYKSKLLMVSENKAQYTIRR